MYILTYTACNAHASNFICGLPGPTIFSTLSHKRQFYKKEKVNEHKICFDFLYTFCLKHFSFLEEMSETCSKMYIGLHLKYSLFFSDFNET
jgi:hypothetical protein